MSGLGQIPRKVRSALFARFMRGGMADGGRAAWLMVEERHRDRYVLWDMFVVLGSDGLWGVLSDTDAVSTAAAAAALKVSVVAVSVFGCLLHARHWG
jgi:hypothetical protein